MSYLPLSRKGEFVLIISPVRSFDVELNQASLFVVIRFDRVESTDLLSHFSCMYVVLWAVGGYLTLHLALFKGIELANLAVVLKEAKGIVDMITEPRLPSVYERILYVNIIYGVKHHI